MYLPPSNYTASFLAKIGDMGEVRKIVHLSYYLTNEGANWSYPTIDPAVDNRRAVSDGRVPTFNLGVPAPNVDMYVPLNYVVIYKHVVVSVSYKFISSVRNTNEIHDKWIKT